MYFVIILLCEIRGMESNYFDSIIFHELKINSGKTTLLCKKKTIKTELRFYIYFKDFVFHWQRYNLHKRM